MNTCTDKKHIEEIVKCAKDIGKIRNGRIDGYYMSALYLLLLPALKHKASRHISRDGICFEDMLENEAFSTGEAELVRLAANLFNGLTPADPGALADLLDEENFMTAISAVMFRKYGYTINFENTED